MEQQHLNHRDTVNLGSFYTPEPLVDIVYSLLGNNIPNFAKNRKEWTILDTSCGYGGFLRGENVIGADIDKNAIQITRGNTKDCVLFTHNSLFNISRSQYNLRRDSKIIIVGNPPYNDTTSIIRNSIKKVNFERDSDVFSRDLGISFLLSYDKLQADYICVLHPLSYLIKKANFESLGQFGKNYKLIDSVIISSGEFSATSKTTRFPIIIGLYERNLFGMNYNYILNYEFRTRDGKIFTINHHESIGKYITKYPNQKNVSKQDAVAFFYTMRDINALRRSATFVEAENYNTIRVEKKHLALYCYVDIFKEYIPHIPYYFGNSDCFIDFKFFCEIRNVFLSLSAKKHPRLASFADKKYNDSQSVVHDYFKRVLGEHYVD
jgi:methylase of polypeptide subunit release factors